MSSVVFCGGRNVKIILFKSGTSNTGKADARAAGYRPRGYSICIIEEMDWKSRGNYSEIVDCVISRMQLEHLKKRVEEIFTEVDKELIFRSMKHRNDFYSLLMGKRFGTCKCGNIYSEKLPHPGPRRYESYKESIVDHSDILLDERYAEAWEYKDNPFIYVSIIGPIYATGSDYGDTAASIMHDYFIWDDEEKDWEEYILWREGK